MQLNQYEYVYNADSDPNDKEYEFTSVDCESGYFCLQERQVDIV